VTIDGIETAHVIQKGRLPEENIPAYKQFNGFIRIVLSSGQAFMALP